MQSKKFIKELMLKFNEMKKTIKPDSTPTFFKLDSPNYFDGSIFVILTVKGLSKF